MQGNNMDKTEIKWEAKIAPKLDSPIISTKITTLRLYAKTTQLY
jgi:hypothetical protein